MGSDRPKNVPRLERPGQVQTKDKKLQVDTSTYCLYCVKCVKVLSIYCQDQEFAMELSINKQTYEVADAPFRFLLYIIRDELGMTGTKFGCGGGYCGSCTVIVDGVATRSCITRPEDVVGKEIRTVESLAETAPTGEIIALHPVQEAFIAHQTPQCSWCMSGQMMTAVAFLENNQSPSEDEIVEAMGDNYCRCGCYVRIKSAVVEAAEIMSEVA